MKIIEKIKKIREQKKLERELREIEEIYLETPHTAQPQRRQGKSASKSASWGDLDEYFKTQK